MPLSTFFNLPEEKRQKILECAIDEFAQHDYDSASISQIVSRAGIAKGSLYQYFTDKSDLYHYLLELAAQKKAEMLVTAGSPDPNLKVFGTLRHLFQVMASFELQYPQLAKIGYRALNGKSPLPEDIVTKARQSSEQYFVGLIEEGKRRGEIKPEVDAGVAAFIFAAALAELGNFLTSRAGDGPTQMATGGIYPPPASEVEQVYDQIVSILRDGIAPQNDRIQERG